jgi:hypothetical protein
MAFIFRLHEANFKELKGLVSTQTGSDDEKALQILGLWDTTNREQLEAVLEEASRLLHNFLASAKTLVEHTYHHVRDLYSGEPFMSEYQQEVDKRLAKSSVNRFVQGLRNYNLHYRFPIVHAHLSWQRGNPLRSQILLDTQTLGKWDKWDKHAKLYIEKHREGIPVDELALKHMVLIANFYHWLRAREEQLHKVPLQRLRKRIERLRATEAEATLT